MSKKTFSEIVELAYSLEHDFNNLVADAKNRYSLYSLRRPPELSEDLAREGQVNILSPLVIHAAHTIRADLMMNPTEFMAVPLAREPGGAIPRADAKLADNLEKALAVHWSLLNNGRHVDREVIWHQLVSPYAVMIPECIDLEIPDQEDMTDAQYAALVERKERMWIPWRITVPDPITCSFLERDGKPTVMVRRYRQLIRDTQSKYSRRRGTEKEDYDLKYIRDHWEWMLVSDDRDPTSFRQSTSDIHDTEMIWMDDGDCIYHVALNGPGYASERTSGEVVWSGPNPFGRVGAFIVPGSITPMRKPEDRYEPFLWPLMQTVEQLNTIRTIRATSSRNVSGPDNYIAIDPEIIKLYEAQGKKLPSSHKWKKGETPYLLGPVQEKPVHVDPDLDKLEQALTADLQRFLPSPFVHVLDPAILKAATATSILHAAEAGLRLYGPLMSAYDSGVKDLMEALIYSIDYHFTGRKVYAYSTGEESSRGVNLPQGQLYELGSDELDFPYLLHVRTRSMTQAQASAQYDLALKQWILPDGSKGPATFDDLIDAANYSDKEAQKEKLATEQMLASIDPWLQQMAQAEALVEIEYRTGLKLPPIGAALAAEGQESNPSRLPNSAQRMDSPLVVGPQGGTSPTE